jgi:hypothetical protein
MDNEGALCILETDAGLCFFMFDGLDKVAWHYRDAWWGTGALVGEHPRHWVSAPANHRTNSGCGLRGEMRAVECRCKAFVQRTASQRYRVMRSLWQFRQR